MNNPKLFLISTDCQEWREVYVPSWYNEESLYRGICSDYLPNTRVFVSDEARQTIRAYWRDLDRDGDLVQIHSETFERV